MDVWIRQPPPVPEYRSGDPQVDEEMHELLTLPESDELVAIRRRFSKQPRPDDAKHLAAVLCPEVCDAGAFERDRELEATMSTEQRDRYVEAIKQARARHVDRKRLLSFMLNKLAFHGEFEAITRVFSFPGVEEAKELAAATLLRTDDPRAFRVLAEALPPERWSELGAPMALRNATTAWMLVDANQALQLIRPILDDEAPPFELTRAVMFGLTDHRIEEIGDPWIELALNALRSGHTNAIGAALRILDQLETDPAWLDALLAAASTDYAGDDLREMLNELGHRIPRGAKASNKAAKAEPATDPVTAEAPPAGPPPKYRAQPVAKLQKQVRTMLDRAGLRDREKQLVWPAIHVLTRRIKDESKLPVGSTKIGGLPDLPKGSLWPERKGVALSFLAQFRLDEVRKLDPSRTLPKNGLLSFFVDDEHDDYPPKPVVLHIPKLRGLRRIDPPKSFQKRRGGLQARRPYCPCRVKLVPTLTVPSPSHPLVTRKLSDSEQLAYEAHIGIDHPVVSQILGFRNHGYDAENPMSARLLLRLVSDDQADTSWGDEEPLDFYIPQKGLAAKSFSKVYTYIGD